MGNNQQWLRNRNSANTCHKWFYLLDSHYAQSKTSMPRALVLQQQQNRGRIRQRGGNDNLSANTNPLLGMLVNVESHASVVNDDAGAHATRLTKQPRTEKEQLDDDLSQVTAHDKSVSLSAQFPLNNNDDGSMDSCHDQLPPRDKLPAKQPPDLNWQSPPMMPLQAVINQSACLPPLGIKICHPALFCTQNMLHPSKNDEALLELCEMLDNAGSPWYLFDKVASYMEKHVGLTFAFREKIDHRVTLLCRIAQSFPVPKPEDIHMHLETDVGEGEDKYHQ